MTCNDCIYDKVCDQKSYPYEPCEYFKDKSRFSEPTNTERNNINEKGMKHA